jgi:hypothetical protein
VQCTNYVFFFYISHWFFFKLVYDGTLVSICLKEPDLDPLLKYSTTEIRERLVEKYRISEYAMVVRNTVHEITKIVSVSLYYLDQYKILDDI